MTLHPAPRRFAGSSRRTPRFAARFVLAATLCAVPAVVQAQTDSHEQPAGAAPAEPPRLFLRVFGSVQWGATQEKGVPNSFGLGQLALFAKSSLSERVDVLAEIVMEGSTNTRVVTDLERLQITFRFNDYLHLSGGRYHTGIGFYNTAFHHGAYFETPIGRPRVFRFEDEGGVLPVHEVGLTARGVVPGVSQLHYLAEVGNGRAWTETEGATEGLDVNGQKSVNLGVSFRPGRVPGFETGGSFYRDRVQTPGGGSVRHDIAAAFVAYRTATLELLAEWLSLRHDSHDGGRFRNGAGYLQASKAWGRLRPYYRYDRQDIDRTTPLIGFAGDYDAHIVGLRVDPHEWVGLKVEYQRANQSSQRGVDSIKSQLVFVF